MEMSGQFHVPATLPPMERAPDNHWIDGGVDPRAGLDMVSERKIPSPRLTRNWVTAAYFGLHWHSALTRI